MQPGAKHSGDRRGGRFPNRSDRAAQLRHSVFFPVNTAAWGIAVK
jgi:hypothetical protein